MGGYATFKLGAQFPDLFAKGQPVVGPPAQGIWAPPAPPQPGGDRSNTNRMLASFWNVPFMIWNGTQDELVNAASAQQQADEFATQGLRYEWDLFNVGDHFALAINDEYGKAATWLGTTEVDRNPPRVKYVYNPTMDFSTGQLIADHAYWLSGVTLANGSGTAPLGTIDVNSHGFGVGNPTTATGTGAGVLTGGQSPALAYTCQSQNWGTAPAAGSCDGLSTNLPSTRPLDSFDINNTNISNVTINARRAHLTCNATHNSTTVNITMNNCPAVGTLSVSDQTVTEGNGGTQNMTFTVNLSGNTENLPVSILYQTQNGSASSSSDYDSTSGTLTFAPGETSKTISVPIHGDTTYEGNETFTLQLTDGQFATPTSLNATGTINNNDTQPSISIADKSQNEGNSGTSNESLTVSLSEASGLPVTVHYATSDGTADSTDYDSVSGDLTFDPGQTTKTVDVPVHGDTDYELDETFNVHLSSASGASISDADAVGTITNDDAGLGIPNDNNLGTSAKIPCVVRAAGTPASGTARGSSRRSTALRSTSTLASRPGAGSGAGRRLPDHRPLPQSALEDDNRLHHNAN